MNLARLRHYTPRLELAFVLAMMCYAWWLFAGGDLESWMFGHDECWRLSDMEFFSLKEWVHTVSGSCHPPIYLLWLMALAKISPDPVWLRYSSVIPSVLLVPVFYLIGRRVAGTGAAIYMALLVVSSSAIFQNAAALRQYALLIFFQAISFYALLGALPSFAHWRRNAIVSAMFCGLCIMVFYGSAIAIALSQSSWLLYLWWRSRKDPAYAPVAHAWLVAHVCAVAAVAVGLVLFMWVSYFEFLCSRAGHHYVLIHSILTWDDFTRITEWVFNYFLMRESADVAHPFYYLQGWQVGLIFFLSGLLLLARSKQPEHRGLLFMVVLIFAVAYMLAMTYLYPLTGSRHSMAMQLFFALPVAVLFGFFWRVKRVFGIVLLLWYPVFTMQEGHKERPVIIDQFSYKFEDFSEVLKDVKAMAKPEDHLFFAFSEYFSFYTYTAYYSWPKPVMPTTPVYLTWAYYMGAYEPLPEVKGTSWMIAYSPYYATPKGSITLERYCVKSGYLKEYRFSDDKRIILCELDRQQMYAEAKLINKPERTHVPVQLHVPNGY